MFRVALAQQQRFAAAAAASARLGSRAFSAPAAAAASASADSIAADPEYQAWLQAVKGYKVVVPKFEWTLEWALPTPVPTHQFEQSPVVIEVTDRNETPEKLVHNGPDVVAGYPDPEKKGAFLTMEEHAKRGYGKSVYEKEWISSSSEPAGAGKFKEEY